MQGRAPTCLGGRLSAQPAVPDLPLRHAAPAARPLPTAENTPTAEAAIGSLEQQYPDAFIGFDHFAFRTFGVRCCCCLGAAGCWSDACTGCDHFGCRMVGEQRV